MLRRSVYGLSTFLLLGSLLLSACAPKAAPAPKVPGDKPAAGGTFNWYIRADPDVLIPYFGKSTYGAVVWQEIFGEGGLLTINAKNEPEAYMAKSWKHSDDNLVWTFTLRDDVKFQDGQPLTADDVVFSYSIPMSPEYTGTSRSSFDAVKEIKALDPHTVQITLKLPYAPFLFNTVTSPIMPKHAFPDGIKVNDIPKQAFAKKPFGAGPYKFVTWEPGRYVEVAAFPDYFEARENKGPFIQTIRYKIISETQTAIAALEAGEIDYYDSMEAQFVDRFKTEFKDRLAAYDWDRNGFGYQTLNLEKFPTNDKAVRRAMSMALNKDAILKGPLGGRASVPPGPIPPVSWAFDPTVKGLTYDPAAAKKLLDDAGYKPGPNGVRVSKDGKPLVIDYYATKGNPLIEAIALESKKDWTDLGLQVNLNFIDFNILLERHMEPGDFNVTFSGFSLGVDPDSFYNIYHSSMARKDAQGLVKGNNQARYVNPDVDRILEEARRTFDIEKRKQLYSQFQRQIIEDAPNIWIYANHYTDFVAGKVKGVVNRPGAGTDFPNQWYMTPA